MRWLGTALFCCVSAMSMYPQVTKRDMQEWQQAAGGAMSFEVASVRPDNGPFKPPSFALSDDDSFRDPKGHFHADFSLPVYIEFAYKTALTNEERRVVLEKLPAWVKTDRFAIEATAPLQTTKDQYRLMMQALLAERFGLKLHFERREMPVLAMVLLKPGVPGPQLIPHSKGQPCDEKPRPETFPWECYLYGAKPSKNGLFLAGSRATSMDLIANFIGSLAGASEEIGRRVVDRTGLTGLWDFTVEGPSPGQVTKQESGTTILEAIHDQLGIKLRPERAVIPVMVIDHVERPTEN